MKITQEVNIDVVNYGSPPVIYATQGDDLSRQIKINLRNNGKSLEIPADSSGIVRYKREDGHGGNYDTNANGEKAVEFSGSAAVVQIAPSVLSFPGIVDFVLAIVHGDSVLHTFSLQINVKENPGVSGSENDDFYLAGTLPDSGWEPNMYLGTDKDGKVVAKAAINGSVTQEQIQEAVDSYLDKNPVAPGATAEQAAQIQANTEAIADIQDPVVSGTLAVAAQKYTLTMPLESGGTDVVTVETDSNDYPTKITYNGREVPWTVTGV